MKRPKETYNKKHITYQSHCQLLQKQDIGLCIFAHSLEAQKLEPYLSLEWDNSQKFHIMVSNRIKS